MIRVTDCTPCAINIDLVVITTSSVYCDHIKGKKQQQANRQTKHQTSKPKKQMKKKNKRKETKNKQNKKFSKGSNLGPLDVESLA